MISLLTEILCVLEQMAAAIIGLLVVMVNAMIVGLAAFLSVILALLPEMPEPPGAPSSGVLQVVNFIVPLAPLAALLVTMGALFLGFIAVRMALNWLKAL